MMNMRDMLGESGRTMSNKDMLEMLSNRNIRDILGESGKTISNMDRSMMGMSDNEPRFETRSPDNQMFSIENEISNLMKSYNMLVDAQEFGRAQEVANMIDQLQQQKIGIQAQRDPMINPMTQSQREVLGEYGKTISNIDRDEISKILDSIAI